MMADDAEIDEEIERQLDNDAHERDYLTQPLLEDEKDLHVSASAFLYRLMKTYVLVYC